MNADQQVTCFITPLELLTTLTISAAVAVTDWLSTCRITFYRHQCMMSVYRYKRTLRIHTNSELKIQKELINLRNEMLLPVLAIASSERISVFWGGKIVRLEQSL